MEGKWMSVDKAAHVVYSFNPTRGSAFGHNNRYLVCYHEDRLYSVRDREVHTLTLVKARSPEEAFFKAVFKGQRKEV
jgi:hypothetical protein